MNSLQNMTNGTLYYLDCTFLAEIRFIRESPDTIALYFSEKPSEDFPQKFFLMPEGRQFDYRVFIFTLTEEIHSCEPSENEDGRYVVHAVTKDIPEQRKNFRVYVTFDASLLLEGQSQEKYVKIKDIGTGGFQFVSKQKFEPGSIVFTIFPGFKAPLNIKARIEKQRPVRREGLYGYGCRFIDLSPKAETMIRNYVYQTEVLQAKARKEIEENS